MDIKREKKHDRLIFFKDEFGKIAYNELCKNCKKACKQSFRTTIIVCNDYEHRLSEAQNDAKKSRK